MKLSVRFVTLGLIGLQGVFVLLFFDPKVHIGGDDSDYIIASIDFLHGQAFPSWHGSFYPIFLSPFILIFGTHIVLLKSISAVLTLLSLWVLKEAIKNLFSEKVIYF